MEKLLIVIDPQVDFISGSLPVGGAAKAMDGLASFIKKHDGDYIYKIVTTDWHPYNHCSFSDNGGEWPRHCVQNTVGAAIYPALIEPLYTTAGVVKVLQKGVFEDIEEYSIFKNQRSCRHIREIVGLLGVKRIDICGIAGDICVLNTLKDGAALYGESMFNVLGEYCPSIDGGKALNEYNMANQ